MSTDLTELNKLEAWLMLHRIQYERKDLPPIYNEKGQTMTRYIDADALEKAIYEWMPKDQSTWMDSTIPPIENLVVSIMMTIQEQPTVDAVPVRYGHWVFNPNGMDWGLPAWVCSECHQKNDMIPTHIWGKDSMIRVTKPLRWAGSNFCPNCGARMDEDND